MLIQGGDLTVAGAGLALDHVIFVTRDADRAAERLLRAHGLGSLRGGRHEGHGTGNRIVPLGPDYLELMTIVDEAEAAASPLGQWVTDMSADGDRLAALCLRTDDLDAIADRLGLSPATMSRIREDGEVLRWRLAGLEAALTRSLPFFIQWEIPDEAHPGRMEVSHTADPTGIAWIELGGDPDELIDRLGPHDLPIHLVGGAPGIHRLAVATAEGEVVLTVAD
ncbi:MAG: VOC family protein, partial [Nitriliruptorales bacterium]